MTDPRDEISKIIESAESAAYLRGWQDAVDAVAELVLGVKSRDPESVSLAVQKNPDIASAIVPRTSGRPPSKAIQIVEDCILASPGMKGVQVVKAAQLIDSSIKERTVRTCLRRLRMSKVIWQRNSLWYPKSKRTEHENGEATSSPPH